MAENTKIEWTDATWNPVRGCSRVSEGCRHCYAETIAARFSDVGQPYHGFAERGRPGSKWTGKVDVIWPAIELPLRWRKPRRIFVNSMSDFFHEAADQEELATVFAVMVAAHHLRGHTFQILTKRAERMRWLLTQRRFWDQVNAETGATVLEHTDPLNRRSDDARATCRDDYGPGNPPPGIWLGVSVENQPAADERIPLLRQTPATKRFLSCEPTLGEMKIREHLMAGPDPGMCRNCGKGHGFTRCPNYGGVARTRTENGCAEFVRANFAIDWVICGGESGPDARPMHPAWVRGLRDQCVAAGVPFFFKQWGEWTPGVNVERHHGIVKTAEWFDGQWILGTEDLARDDGHIDDEPDLYRVGKKHAGAALDGREWREFPTPGA